MPVVSCNTLKRPEYENDGKGIWNRSARCLFITSVGTWFIMYVLDKINSNVVGFDYRGGAESEMIAGAKKKMIKYFIAGVDQVLELY